VYHGPCSFGICVNLGVRSLEAGRLIKPSGQVVAVEANPSLFAILCDNVQLNGYNSFVKCHGFAAWNKEDQVEFSAEADAHRVGAVRLNNAMNFGEDTVTIAARPLDALAVDPVRLTLVKIDVEGREAFVIEGLKQTLSKSSYAIVAEYQPGLIDQTYGLERFHDLMRSLNRMPHAIDLSTEGFVALETMPSGHTNLVWLPKE